MVKYVFVVICSLFRKTKKNQKPVFNGYRLRDKDDRHRDLPLKYVKYKIKYSIGVTINSDGTILSGLTKLQNWYTLFV